MSSTNRIVTTLDDVIRFVPRLPTTAPPPEMSNTSSNPIIMPTTEPSRPLKYQEFLSKCIKDLKDTYGIDHADAFCQAAEYWGEYKQTGQYPTFKKPIACITEPIPLPIVNPPAALPVIRIFKNTSESVLTITEDEEVLFHIPYIGQASVWESLLKQVLETMGVSQFKEYCQQLIHINQVFR